MKNVLKRLKSKRFWLVSSIIVFFALIVAGCLIVSVHFSTKNFNEVDQNDNARITDIWNGSASSSLSGSGTSSNPYLIQSGADLKYLSNNYSSYTSTTYFKQTVDIDLNNRDWTPINASNSSNYYCYYDGDGHKFQT